MTRLVVALCAIGAAAACTGAAPPARPAPNPTEDARAVEAVVRSWYDASERRDSAAWVSPLLPEFFIFEDTTVYDKANLTRLVVESFAAGIDRAELSDFNTVVAGDVAWTSFRNNEVFTPTGAPALPARRYLETAVFRRETGRWMMERYHATRINRPAPTP